MAFNSKKIIGDGTTQVAIANGETTEAVITALIAYNTSDSTLKFSLLLDDESIVTEKVSANDSFRLKDKLSVPAGVELKVHADKNVNTTISFFQQPADIASATTLVQSVYDNAEDITVVSSNIEQVQNVSDNMDTVAKAYDNALIAQSATSYKGNWTDDYNDSDGYAMGDSVTYTDGLAYTSRIADNTDEPSVRTSTDSWMFVLGGLSGASVVDCGSASNENTALYDAGSASSY